MTALVAAAREAGLTAHVGVTVASDTFYRDRSGTTRSPVTCAGHSRAVATSGPLHVLNYEMESATLFTQCAVNGWRAGMVAGVLVNRTQQEIPDPSA